MVRASSRKPTQSYRFGLCMFRMEPSTFGLGLEHPSSHATLAQLCSSAFSLNVKPSKNKEAPPRRTSQRRADEKVDYVLPVSPGEDPEHQWSEDATPGLEYADQSDDGRLLDSSQELLSSPMAVNEPRVTSPHHHGSKRTTQGETSVLREELTSPVPLVEAPPSSSSSSSPPPATRVSLTPFNTPAYRFECICGELGLVDYKARVQCMNCQLWQHAQCVNYKEESRETTPFYCPHCLVAMTPVPTGATLIISPSSICHQWVEEIRRHISSSSLRVLVRGAASEKRLRLVVWICVLVSGLF